jgi:hypothetical protein
VRNVRVTGHRSQQAVTLDSIHYCSCCYCYCCCCCVCIGVGGNICTV